MPFVTGFVRVCEVIIMAEIESKNNGRKRKLIHSLSAFAFAVTLFASNTQGGAVSAEVLSSEALGKGVINSQNQGETEEDSLLSYSSYGDTNDDDADSITTNYSRSQYTRSAIGVDSRVHLLDRSTVSSDMLDAFDEIDIISQCIALLDSNATAKQGNWSGEILFTGKHPTLNIFLLTANQYNSLIAKTNGYFAYNFSVPEGALCIVNIIGDGDISLSAAYGTSYNGIQLGHGVESTSKVLFNVTSANVAIGNTIGSLLAPRSTVTTDTGAMYGGSAIFEGQLICGKYLGSNEFGTAVFSDTVKVIALNSQGEEEEIIVNPLEDAINPVYYSEEEESTIVESVTAVQLEEIAEEVVIEEIAEEVTEEETLEQILESSIGTPYSLYDFTVSFGDVTFALEDIISLFLVAIPVTCTKKQYNLPLFLNKP